MFPKIEHWLKPDNFFIQGINFDVLSSKVKSWTNDHIRYCLKQHILSIPFRTRWADSIQLRIFFFRNRRCYYLRYYYCRNQTNDHFSSSRTWAVALDSYSSFKLESMELETFYSRPSVNWNYTNFFFSG